MSDYPKNNAEILECLDHYVFGHTEAKKALITMLSRSTMRSYQKYIKGVEDQYLLSPMKVLLVGASGTGKTFLLETLQSIVHFPLIRADATNLTPSGASGGLKADDLQKQIIKNAAKCCADFPFSYPSIDSAIDRTVVFIDEIDKLGTSFESSGNWNKHVQSNFLTTFDNKVELSGVSFVFAGAFGGITEPTKPKSLGFTHGQKHTEQKELIDLRILKSGLIPEIVGRITAICELDVFTADTLYDILINRVLPKKRIDLATYYLFDTTLSESVMRAMAEEAALSGQGVRYLQRAVDKVFMDLEFDVDVQQLIINDWSSVI